MPSQKDVEKAFQGAVDRALCRVSRRRCSEITPDEINYAMKELARLKAMERQPNYGHRDVALFYTQQYLPRQINATYSESVQVLSQSRLPSANTLQLMDFGSGTGAMIIGLALAIATRLPRAHQPERLKVYQIDHPAMLELGRDVWHYIRDESRHQPLRGIGEVMDRVQFEGIRISNKPYKDSFPRWEDATRWLSAIHVTYQADIATINSKMELLCEYLRPDVRIRTAPKFKTPLLESYPGVKEQLRPIRLCMDGDAPRVTSLRQDLRSPIRDLNLPVLWTHTGRKNSPFSETVFWPEAVRHD